MIGADLVLEDVLVCDIVGGAREFRLAMGQWAKGYAASRQLGSLPANENADAAHEDLRRWSNRYFAPLGAGQ